MKTKYILPAAIASLAFANIGAAQIGFNQLEHKLTVKLSVDYQGEYDRDEKGEDYKDSLEIVTEKFSNKELLEVLAELGVIDEVKGWEILLITDSSANIVDVIARNKDGGTVSIEDYFSGEAVSEGILGFEGKYDDSEDFYEAEYEYQTIAQVGLDFEFFEAEAQGVLKMETELYDYDGDETEFITAASFTSLSGEVTDGEETYGIITGEVEAGKGKEIPFEQNVRAN